MGVERLEPGLFRMLCGRFQCYVWQDADGVTLIDTGAADGGAEIALGLDEIGLRPQDVDRIVLTHCHDDHAGAAAEIHEWNDIPVIASAVEAPILRGEQTAPEPRLTGEEAALYARLATGLPPSPPVEIAVEVSDGDVLDFGGGAEVLAVPGHTAGSIALYLPASGVLFTGDAVAQAYGRTALGVFNLDPDEAARSLRRLAALDARVALFGHGEPVLADAAARLREAAGAL